MAGSQAWVPLHTTDLVWELQKIEGPGATVTMDGSTITAETGDPNNAAWWKLRFSLGAPTPIRATNISYTSPNPADETAGIGGTDQSVIYNTSPTPLGSWEPNPIGWTVGTTDPSFFGILEAETGSATEATWLIEAYVDYTPPEPTGCFWTDYDEVSETCAGVDPPVGRNLLATPTDWEDDLGNSPPARNISWNGTYWDVVLYGENDDRNKIFYIGPPVEAGDRVGWTLLYTADGSRYATVGIETIGGTAESSDDPYSGLIDINLEPNEEELLSFYVFVSGGGTGEVGDGSIS